MAKRPASEKLLAHLETVKDKTGKKKSPDDQIKVSSHYKRRYRQQKKHEHEISLSLAGQKYFKVIFQTISEEDWIDQDFPDLETALNQARQWASTAGSRIVDSTGRELIQITRQLHTELDDVLVTIWEFSGTQKKVNYKYFNELTQNQIQALLYR